METHFFQNTKNIKESISHGWIILLPEAMGYLTKNLRVKCGLCLYELVRSVTLFSV